MGTLVLIIVITGIVFAIYSVTKRNKTTNNTTSGGSVGGGGSVDGDSVYDGNGKPTTTGGIK